LDERVVVHRVESDAVLLRTQRPEAERRNAPAPHEVIKANIIKWTFRGFV